MNINFISKKIKWLVPVLVVLTIFSSCTSGFEEFNRPGNKVSLEELNRDSYLAGSFFIQLQNNTFPEQENAYQMDQDLIGNYLSRYMTYANNGFAAKNFALFNAPDGWVKWPYQQITPKIVSAFDEIERVSNKEGINYAWALILKSHAILRLTDKYGPFPIGTEKDRKAYSSQEDVYKALFADLDTAIEILKPLITANPDLVANATYDNVYGGQVIKWYHFANSLKLRMAIRVRFVEPELAKMKGEEAVRDGVIMANDGNCAITYTPNGLYKVSVEWGDTRACADIESYMTGYKDPRMEKYFKNTEDKAERNFVGCLAGADVGNKTIADKKYSAINVDKNSRGVWMTASEITFCRAEGALAGWANMGGTAGELYEKAITLSFEEWEVDGAATYVNDATSTEANYTDAEGGYGKSVAAQSTITIKWDDSASDEEKLERLITQKWIALFPNGQEGWNEIRRTGYPKVFPLAQDNGTSLKVANRIPFDVDEKVNNPENYNKAVTLLNGEDNYTTKMWWQK